MPFLVGDAVVVAIFVSATLDDIMKFEGVLAIVRKM